MGRVKKMGRERVGRERGWGESGEIWERVRSAHERESGAIEIVGQERVG